KEGFEVLFDGTNLDKWTENQAYVVNDEGYIWVYPNAKFGGNLYTKEEYADFIYRFDFKLTPGANNGVGIRAPLEGDAAYEAMEIQVLDDGADVYKDLKQYQYHGSIYGVVPAKKGHLKPVGEWNSEEIVVKGNRIKVTLNGAVIVDADIAEASKNGTLDGKQHPGLKRTSGHIGFLGHGTEVFFKDIRVKKLK
ncbi:MAG: 3-keto-disaccharide hydrolase, partial [Sphingobacterium siyangense]